MRSSQRSLMDTTHIHSLMRARGTLLCVYSLVLSESSLRLTSKYGSVCHCLSAHGWTPHTRTHACRHNPTQLARISSLCCPCLPLCWPFAVHVATHMDTAPSRVHCPMKDGRTQPETDTGATERQHHHSNQGRIRYAQGLPLRASSFPVAIRPPLTPLFGSPFCSLCFHRQVTVREHALRPARDSSEQKDDTPREMRQGRTRQGYTQHNAPCT